MEALPSICLHSHYVASLKATEARQGYGQDRPIARILVVSPVRPALGSDAGTVTQPTTFARTFLPGSMPLHTARGPTKRWSWGPRRSGGRKRKTAGARAVCRRQQHAIQVRAARPRTTAANPAASAAPMCHSRASPTSLRRPSFEPPAGWRGRGKSTLTSFRARLDAGCSWEVSTSLGLSKRGSNATRTPSRYYPADGSSSAPSPGSASTAAPSATTNGSRQPRSHGSLGHDRPHGPPPHPANHSRSIKRSLGRARIAVAFGRRLAWLIEPGNSITALSKNPSAAIHGGPQW